MGFKHNLVVDEREFVPRIERAWTFCPLAALKLSDDPWHHHGVPHIRLSWALVQEVYSACTPTHHLAQFDAPARDDQGLPSAQGGYLPEDNLEKAFAYYVT